MTVTLGLPRVPTGSLWVLFSSSGMPRSHFQAPLDTSMPSARQMSAATHHGAPSIITTRTSWPLKATVTATGIVTLRPIVIQGADGKPVTSSRDVAAYFGKPHNDVLKAIRALLSEAPAIEGNFSRIELDVKVGFGTRKDPAYLMDRDGPKALHASAC